MRHRNSGRKLNRTASHRKAMFANMAAALIEHEQIVTTLPKAKDLRPIVERLVTLAKRGDLHARRQVLTTVTDRDVVHKMFEEIGPSFSARDGGYTRITKIGPRKGDNAPLAVIELVSEEAEVRTRRRRTRRPQPAAPAAPAGRPRRGKAAEAEAPAEEPVEAADSVDEAEADSEAVADTEEPDDEVEDVEDSVEDADEDDDAESDDEAEGDDEKPKDA